MPDATIAAIFSADSSQPSADSVHLQMSRSPRRSFLTLDPCIHKLPGAAAGIAGSGLALGATAIGAFAIGAVAIGALVIRKVAIRSARIERLSIGELTVDRLVIKDSAPNN